MTPRRSFVALLSFALLPSAIASAEPISIASGTATTSQQPLIGSGDFNLVAADGTAIIVHWPDFTFITAARLCQGCQPGTTVSADGRIFPTGTPVLGQAGPYPSGSVGGVGMLFDGNLVFTGGDVVLPSVAPPEPTLLTLDVPFTFGGQLNGYTINFGAVSPAFSRELNGAGIAHLQFSGSPFGNFTSRGTIYEFQPTPEPATATTVLLGLAALYRRRRMHTKRRTRP